MHPGLLGPGPGATPGRIDGLNVWEQAAERHVRQLDTSVPQLTTNRFFGR